MAEKNKSAFVRARTGRVAGQSSAHGARPRLDFFQRLGSIAGSATVIVGVITALVQINSGIKQAGQTLNALKLQALEEIIGLLDLNYEIRIKQVEFTMPVLEAQLAKARNKVANNETGEEIYLSTDFKNFRDIAAHYERLGAIVTLGYLEFGMIFQVVPFPEGFWNRTRPLRQLIGETWAGIGRPLPDFLENFKKLCTSYRTARNAQHPGTGDRLDCS